MPSYWNIAISVIFRCSEHFYNSKPCWSNMYLHYLSANIINTLRPRQNGRHFADDTFKRISMNQNVRNSIKISLKFVPKGLINNIPALVQIMAWRRPGDKPLSEPMMVSLLTHICVTRSQWVNPLLSNSQIYGDWVVQSFSRRIVLNVVRILNLNICYLLPVFVYVNSIANDTCFAARKWWLHESKHPLVWPYIWKIVVDDKVSILLFL